MIRSSSLNSPFDLMLRAASKRSLQNFIQFNEEKWLERKVSNGVWGQLSEKQRLSHPYGLLEHHQELDVVEQDVNAKYGVMTKNGQTMGFDFRYNPRHGDKMIEIEGVLSPEIEGVSSPFGKKIPALNHQAGQVILLVTYENKSSRYNWPRFHHFFKCTQDMLLKKQAVWQNQVRVVTMNSFGLNPRNVKDQQGHLVNWDLIEHLELNRTRGKKNFIEMLERPGGDAFFILMNKEGAIDYYGGDLGVTNFQTRIEKLLVAPITNQTLSISQEFPPSITESRLQYLRNLMSKPPLCPFPFFKLKLAQKRSLKFGLKKLIGYLRFQYMSDQNQKELLQFTERIIKDLLPEQFITPNIFPTARFMQLNFEKAKSILRRYGIEKDPIIVEKASIDFLEQNTFIKNQILSYPDLAYKKQCSFTQAKRIFEDLQMFNIISSFKNVLPIRIIGEKFQGIHKLKGTNQSIEHKSGTALLLIKLQHLIETQELISLADSENRLEIHIFQTEGQKQFVDKIKNCKNIFIYGRCSDNQDLKAYGFYTNTIGIGSSYSMTVNRQGVIIQSHRQSSFIDVLEKINKWEPQQKNIDFLSYLENLPTLQQTLTLREVVNSWDYTPEVSVSYSKYISYHGKQNLRVQGSLHIHIRKDHQSFTDYLVKAFKRFGFTIFTKYIQTVNIQKGNNCQDCRDILCLPYYFYPWSKVYRCFECAEAEDTNQKELLKRFAINQNAVLITAVGKNVDLVRLYKNIQPKKNKNKKDYQVICRDCYNRTMAFYACLGCSRLPDMTIDHERCLKCIKKFLNKDPSSKLLSKAKHLYQHPFLRTIFRQQSRM